MANISIYEQSKKELARNILPFAANMLKTGKDAQNAFQLISLKEEALLRYKARVIFEFSKGDAPKWKEDKSENGVGFKSFGGWCSAFLNLSLSSASLYRQAGEKVTEDGYHSIYFAEYGEKWHGTDLGYTTLSRLAPLEEHFIKELLDGNFVTPATKSGDVQKMCKAIQDNKELLTNAYKNGEFSDVFKTIWARTEKAVKAKKATPKDAKNESTPEAIQPEAVQPEAVQPETEIELVPIATLCERYKGKTVEITIDGVTIAVVF